MSTSTTNAPAKQRKPRPRPARSIRILEQPTADTDNWGALEITVGKVTDRYLLHFIPTDFAGALAFEVEKLASDLTTLEQYHVLLAGPGEHDTCECKGHLQHGHKTVCKHVAGIKALRAAGQLTTYRSMAAFAKNDPAGHADHEAAIAGVFTPRAKDRTEPEPAA